MKAEYEYKMLNTRDLRVEPTYQREVDARRVARMMKKYNPCLVNAVKVSYRDGKYWIFDGQHTMAMLKGIHGGNDVTVECKVFYGLSLLDEVELFLLQTGDSAKVRIEDVLRAQYNTGDPEVVGLVRAIERAGFRIDFKKSSASGKIVAYSTVFQLWRHSTHAAFEDGLAIVNEAWGGIVESTRAEILTAVVRFCGAYSGRYKRDALIKRLKVISPLDIIRDGKMAVSGGANRYAKIILQIYNKGRQNKLDPALLD